MIPWPKPNIADLFQVEHPIIQGGMIWISGAKLVAAVSNTGCLGLIGAGSMPPEVLRRHIQKTKLLTQKPFGVNLPLLYSGIEEQLNICIEEGVKIFFTSAGSPKLYTQKLRDQGCTVVHVTSSIELVQKCQDAGVHAVVLEGFEAGGHNGRDELTTLVLLQQAQNQFKIPIIAAGGIGSGAAIAAAFVLGAQGVQIGTLFAATTESSAHMNFKNAMRKAKPNATLLCMRKTVPVRLMLNEFALTVREAENNGATAEELKTILGKGRAKIGMFEGDLKHGELEIGQIVSEVQNIQSCADVVKTLVEDFCKSPYARGAAQK